MRLLLIKERLFLFGEFAVSKTQCLYNKACSRLSVCGVTQMEEANCARAMGFQGRKWVTVRSFSRPKPLVFFPFVLLSSFLHVLLVDRTGYNLVYTYMYMYLSNWSFADHSLILLHVGSFCLFPW